MDLGLSLPKSVENTGAGVELRAGKLASWLDSLPILNLVDTSYKIFQSLSATNRTHIDDKTRLKLLETYRQPIATICDELEKEFIGNSLPLSTKALQASTRARGLQTEMAIGYKILAQDLAENLDGKIKDKVKAQLAMTVQRAIYHLASSLYYSYISYHPALPGTWKEIHRLYEFASLYQATEIEIDDPLNQTKGNSTASKNYKNAILMDLSGPYHLPGRSVQNIYHCLDTWGDLASLEPATSLPKESCQFLITKERDSSGEIYDGKNVNAAQLKNYLMLNTLELARHVHTRLKALNAGKVPEEQGVRGGVFTEENSRELLTKLVSSWGVNPKRNFRRLSRKGDSVEVALGIESINFWINGGETLTLSSEFVGPMPQKSKMGTLYMENSSEKEVSLTSVELENNPELKFVEWDVVDESAGGIALSTSRAKHQRTKVGDIMAIRDGKAGHWEIVVIRWIQNTDSETVSVGTQRLAPEAVPIAINVLDDSGEDTKFKPALLLPAMQALKQPATIVAEKSSLQRGQRFFMDNGYQMNEAQAARVLESTTAFERFEFSIIQTA
jgi:hypothetical protein